MNNYNDECIQDYSCPDCSEAKLQSDKNARKINEVIDQVNALIQVNNETVDFIEEKANEVVEEIAEIKVNEALGDIRSSLDNKASKEICINVKEYGAIGDGESHKLNEKYNTLEQAKVDFPNAETMNDEIDRLAIQKAIDNNNGNIFIPTGVYQIDKTLILKSKLYVCGAGRENTILKVKQNIMGILSNHFVKIENLGIETDLWEVDIIGSENTSSAISTNNFTGCEYQSLYIRGFNKGLDFGNQSWCNSIKNTKIIQCNEGIFGSGEFNDIQISKANITYCDKGLYIGGGRSIVVRDSDIERNNTGINKTNYGDLEVLNNYFESNTNGSVNITFGQDAVDFVLINGNTFFEISPTNIINYHTLADNLIVIENNYFSSYSYDLWENNIIAINPVSGTQCICKTKNNRLKNVSMCKSGFEGLIADSSITSKYNVGNQNYKLIGDYNLDTAYKTGVRCVRLLANNDVTITMPFINDGSTLQFLFGSNQIKDLTGMQIVSPDGLNVIVNGFSSILKTNTIYTLIFNRFIDSNTVELIMCG